MKLLLLIALIGCAGVWFQARKREAHPSMDNASYSERWPLIERQVTAMIVIIIIASFAIITT